MKLFKLFSILTLGILVVTCSTTKQPMDPMRARQLKPSEVRGYHNAVEMKIAWFPYEELVLKKTKENNWVMVDSDTGRVSAIPVIMITYPDSKDSIWIDMNIKNQLLGKLLKHTLMTQQPITEPFSEYFANAKCTKCHPSNVKVNFNW